MILSSTKKFKKLVAQTTLRQKLLKYKRLGIPEGQFFEPNLPNTSSKKTPVKREKRR